jgi:hypothetical protein
MRKGADKGHIFILLNANSYTYYAQVLKADWGQSYEIINYFPPCGRGKINGRLSILVKALI